MNILICLVMIILLINILTINSLLVFLVYRKNKINKVKELTTEEKRKIEMRKKEYENFLSYSGDEQ